ncbi:MAG: hypothetical protein IPM48_07325 [Saprospiraceae bacterium]|nr:hypothetical protein [Saprospiraceae bacterium]
MKIKILYSFLLVCLAFFSLRSQNILVLNEGALDFSTGQMIQAVSFGSYSLTDKQYTKLYDIEGSRFASDLHLDGDSYWIAADEKILRYQLKTHALLSELKVKGVRKIFTTDQYLIVSRGEYLVQLNSYVQIYDKSNLELKYELPASEFSFTTENILVHDQKAYIIANNGFDFGNEVGKILVIDLNKLELEKTIDLGPESKNPENLVHYKNHLYTLNNRNFTDGSTISKISIDRGEVVSTTLLPNISSLCGTSVLVESSIVYQESGKNETGRYDLNNDLAGFYKNANASYYGLSYDLKSEFILGGVTDFFSFGKVFIMNKDLEIIEEFNTGISPGYFIVDQISSNQSNPADVEKSLLVSNIANNQLILDSTIDPIGVHCISSNGQTIPLKLNHQTIDASSLLPGIYTLMISTREKITTERFVKF